MVWQMEKNGKNPGKFFPEYFYNFVDLSAWLFSGYV